MSAHQQPPLPCQGCKPQQVEARAAYKAHTPSPPVGHAATEQEPCREPACSEGACSVEKHTFGCDVRLPNTLCTRSLCSETHTCAMPAARLALWRQGKGGCRVNTFLCNVGHLWGRLLGSFLQLLCLLRDRHLSDGSCLGRLLHSFLSLHHSQSRLTIHE